MSNTAYMVWFIATALMIVVVLTVGTLAAAGLLGRSRSAAEPDVRATRSEPAAPDITRHDSAALRRDERRRAA